jgi:hypothetical protein
MAKRTGGNVNGDLYELRVTQLLIEHGLAINSLTGSDTGWDLHCHVPDGLYRRASEAGRASWLLSGRSAHVQVKSAPRGRLRLGTVRGWTTGAASGVPTFFFSRLRDKPVFSSPADLAEWLSHASNNADDDDDHRYTLRGTATALQKPLTTHFYSEARFPSVLQLWVRFPQLALGFSGATAWMNHERHASNLLEALVPELANALWADERLGRHTESYQLARSLGALYGAAGFEDAEERADKDLMNGSVDRRMVGDGLVTRNTVASAVASLVDSQDPDGSCVSLLEELVLLHATDAETPVLERKAKKLDSAITLSE